MTQVNTIALENNPYLYSINQDTTLKGGVSNVSVFSSDSSSECTDGKDDGKISLGEAIGNTVKGAAKGLVNGIKGMFTDEEGNFSLGQTLKTAATTAACFIPGVGPVIAGGLCAYGAVKGGIGIAKGVAAAATATTDAQAKEAFQSIGGSGLQTGLSIAGLKASANAIANNASKFAGSSEYTAAVKSGGNIVSKTTALAKDAIAGTKGYYGSAWTKGGNLVSNIASVGKKAATGTADNMLYTAKAIKEEISGVKDKLTKKSGTISDKQMEKLVKKGKVEAQTAEDGSTYYTQSTKKGEKIYTQKTGTEGTKYSYTTENTTSNTTYSTAPKTQTEELGINNLSESAKSKVTGLKKGESITLDDGSVYKALGDNRFKVTTETGATKTVKTTTNEYSSLKKAYRKSDMTKSQYASLKKSGGTINLENGTTVTFDKAAKTATVSKTVDSNIFAKYFGELSGYQGTSGSAALWGTLTPDIDAD